MSKRISGYKHVKQHIECDTEIRYDLYLHSRNQTFMAVWGERRITGNTALEVKKKMEGIIREENALEFFPVIVVKERPPFAQRELPYVSFSQERTYVAHRKNERPLAQIAWNDYRGQTDLQVYKNRLWPPGDFRYRFESLPHIEDNFGEKTFVLAYSDSLWEGLVSLNEAVAQMQERFRMLLSTEHGIKMIQNAGETALLPPGDQQEDKENQ